MSVALKDELPGSEQIIRDEIACWPLDLRRILLSSLLAECEQEAEEQAPPLRPLTARQRMVFDWVARYVKAHSRAPSLREIGEGVGIVSTNGVLDHLRSIERKGYITWERGVARSLRVLRRPS